MAWKNGPPKRPPAKALAPKQGAELGGGGSGWWGGEKVSSVWRLFAFFSFLIGPFLWGILGTILSYLFIFWAFKQIQVFGG